MVESVVKHLLRDSVTAQRAYRRYLRRQRLPHVPKWDDILSTNRELWERHRTAPGRRPRVLIATSTGGHPASPPMESLLAAALTLRGADVHFLLCDSMLPACLMSEVRLMEPGDFAKSGPQRYFCKHCLDYADDMYRPLGLPVHRFSEWISADEIREAEELSKRLPVDQLRTDTRDGVALGEHALAGALRYFARADLAGQPHADGVLRRCFSAALQTSTVMTRLLDRLGFESVCLNHALYVPQGIVAETARARGCRVVAWNLAYRKQSFIFSHGETYHHTFMNEPVSEWEDISWNDARESEIVDYLESRRGGSRDWIAFQAKNPNEDRQEILAELKIDPGRPVIGMLTNVAWDAQLHYPANAFPDMLTWVRQTVAYFATRPDLQLVIRVHPAEVTGGIASRQRVVDELQAAFPGMPENVRIIPPDSPIGTYAVMDACDSVIIYGTKTGVELTSRGTPVIVAGEAWIRNKGITIDAKSADDYFRILDALPIGRRMAPDLVTRARKYAYHFFFRRMIPVRQVVPSGLKEPPYRLEIARLDELLPGEGRGLDTICDGILKGTPFTYRAEDVGAGEDGR